MILGLLLLAVSAGLLVGGAEWFVESAAGAARRLGVTVLALGVLLVTCRWLNEGKEVSR